MSAKQAKEKYKRYLAGETTGDGEPNYRTEEEFRRCRECINGYNYEWINLTELKLK